MILAKDSYGFEKLLVRVSQVVQRFSVKHSQRNHSDCLEKNYMNFEQKKFFFRFFYSSFQTLFLNGTLDFQTAPIKSTDTAPTSG